MSKAFRGEIWDVQFFPAVGAEIQKIRPALVINVPEVGRLPLSMVVPITDWKPAYSQYPWFVHLPHFMGSGLTKDSGADAFQTKSVSEIRLLQKLGVLASDKVEEVAAAVALCVGYEPLE